MGVGVSVGGGVLVEVGVGVGVFDGDGVGEGVNVLVGVAVAVNVGLGVRVAAEISSASRCGPNWVSETARTIQTMTITAKMTRRVFMGFLWLRPCRRVIGRRTGSIIAGFVNFGKNRLLIFSPAAGRQGTAISVPCSLLWGFGCQAQSFLAVVDSHVQVRYNEIVERSQDPADLWGSLHRGRGTVEPKEIQDFAQTVVNNVERVIVGKREAIEFLMVALLCEGHVLIEDVPGTGKTMLARAVAASLGLSFKRLQCTPDLLPNDITGVSVFNQRSGEFEFKPGPAFVHVLLTDEINRATPRTQSALLESMGEGQVTVDGFTHPLNRPFLVLATQNPIEYEGTFPLPEAQLDRFLLKLSVGYPSLEDESQILLNLQRDHPISTIGQVVEGDRLLDLQREVWEVHVDDTVRDYIVRLIHATRDHPDLALGASPRGSLALFKTAQALAALRGRDFVLPDDVKLLAVPTLVHRLIVRPESALRGYTAARILGDLLQATPLDIGSLE